MAGEWDNLGEESTEYDELGKTKAERDRLARQLYEVKHRRADYLQTVIEAVEGSVRGIQVAPVEVWNPNREYAAGKKEETAVALLSDLQTGKITPDYNSDVCRERVMRYAKKIVKLTEIQRMDHPVRHCVVPLLGDLVEGVDIFPGQQWLIDSTLYRQVFDSTPTIIVDFLRYLLAHFETVTVEAVQGNHGRIGRRGMFGPEDNADRMVHRIIGLLMRDEPRFKLNMADPEGEAAWYKIMTIGNYKALLIHGDQVKPVMGYPFYGLGKKIHGWASGGLAGPGVEFQDVMLGHWHQLARIPLNQRTVWQNGSTESCNTYAAEALAAQSDPKQWLLFCDAEKGRITASYGVDLREDS